MEPQKTIKKSHKSKKPQFVGFSFTSYLEHPPVLHPKMRCMIFQREICQKTLAETGVVKLHWQGAYRLHSYDGVTLNHAVKRYLPHISHKGSRGTWEENVIYCSKKYNEDGTQARANMDVEPTILGDPPKFGSALAEAKISHLKAMYELCKDGVDLTTIIETDPEAFIRNHNAIRFLSEHLEVAETVDRKEIFKIPLIKFEPAKAYIFQGKSGIGKTTYAQAHFKNPLFVSHPDDMKKFRKGHHDAYIFDDMQFLQWPETTQIHLVDMAQDRSIHCRFFNGKVYKGVPRVFTCNPSRYPFAIDEAIGRRVKLINLGEEMLF